MSVDAAPLPRRRRTARSPARPRTRLLRTQDLLHHQVLPLLHAADRAVADGDPDRARTHLHDVALLARAGLRPEGPDTAPVLRAVGAARRVWGTQLAVTVERQDALPDDLPAAATAGLHDVVLTGLHDIATHRPGAAAHVTLCCHDTEVVVSVTGRGPAAGNTAPPDPAAFGLDSLERTVRSLGGALHVHLGADASVLVARLPRGGRWASRWRRRWRGQWRGQWRGRHRGTPRGSKRTGSAATAGR